MPGANCWEIKGCGRQTGGAKVAELGVCPAATDKSCDGVHGGRNAGRICWAVSGTLCGGKKQGTFAVKQMSCMTCEVLRQAKAEVGPAGFKLTRSG